MSSSSLPHVELTCYSELIALLIASVCTHGECSLVEQTPECENRPKGKVVRFAPKGSKELSIG